MEYFGELIETVVAFMKIPFTLWGLTFSLWSVFCWGLLASFVIWAILHVFGGK